MTLRSALGEDRWKWEDSSPAGTGWYDGPTMGWVISTSGQRYWAHWIDNNDRLYHAERLFGLFEEEQFAYPRGEPLLYLEEYSIEGSESF